MKSKKLIYVTIICCCIGGAVKSQKAHTNSQWQNWDTRLCTKYDPNGSEHAYAKCVAPMVDGPCIVEEECPPGTSY